MSNGYIFRKHTTGSSILKDWERSKKIDADAINTMTDTLLKDSPAKIATSIPNPFARMQLFETAFKMVNNNHSGNTVYHQLVSHCLDLFEYLFYHGADPQIIYRKWNIGERLKNFRSPRKADSQKILAQTLGIYFDSEEWRDYREIYMIYYKGMLVGGTSPYTILFTTPNWVRLMNEKGIVLKSPKAKQYFSLNATPLHRRDMEFQIFLHKLKHINRNSIYQNSNAFSEYIRLSAEKQGIDFSSLLRDTLENYDEAKFNDEYSPIEEKLGSPAHIKSGGIKLYTMYGGFDPEKTSDFVIKPTVKHYKNYSYNGNKIKLKNPLVLIQGYNDNLKYLLTKWDPSTQVPDIPQTPLHLRKLPGDQQITYPYLTVGDFFEEKLIKTPYPLNNENFFCGTNDDIFYLLPIKKEYFNYFTSKDLKKNLSIIINDTEIIYKLKIPARKTTLEISKAYDLQKDVVKNNKHFIGWTMNIFPFYQVVDKPEVNKYKINVVKGMEGVPEYQFYKFENVIKKQTCIVTTKERTNLNEYQGSLYYGINELFDMIQVGYENTSVKGLILPGFKQIELKKSSAKFYFGIDFGTSNTHIAYITSVGSEIKSFEIGLNDTQVVSFHKRNLDLKNIEDSFDSNIYDYLEDRDFVILRGNEFVPTLIGEDYDYEYPLRTAVCESDDFSSSQKIDVFGNINVGYYIDKTSFDKFKYTTNIKWGMEINPNDKNAANRVKATFVQTLWLIKNKIILNKGSLDPEISWFYPLSMSGNNIHNFELLWKEAVEEVFGKKNSVIIEDENESLVPYFYLKDKYKFYEADNINIDIGGGTIDILYQSAEGSKKYSLSNRFGANDIWGDAIISNNKGFPQDSGFLKLFMDANPNLNKSPVYESIDNSIKNLEFDSGDTIGLIFRYDKELGFSTLLRNHKYLKGILFLHYSALLYHLSQVFEYNKLDIPMYFSFTGKGSLYLRTIFRDNEDITHYSKMFFKKTCKSKFPLKLEFRMIENPKEVTAMGGVKKIKESEKEVKTPIKFIHPGVLINNDEPKQEEQLLLSDVDNVKEKVIENVDNFLNILFNDPQLKQYFKDKEFEFGGEDVKKFILTVSKLSLNHMLSQQKASFGENSYLEETPFFWALRNVPYELSNKYYKMGKGEK